MNTLEYTVGVCTADVNTELCLPCEVIYTHTALRLLTATPTPMNKKNVC